MKSYIDDIEVISLSYHSFLITSDDLSLELLLEGSFQFGKVFVLSPDSFNLKCSRICGIAR